MRTAEDYYAKINRNEEQYLKNPQSPGGTPLEYLAQPCADLNPEYINALLDRGIRPITIASTQRSTQLLENKKVSSKARANTNRITSYFLIIPQSNYTYGAGVELVDGRLGYEVKHQGRNIPFEVFLISKKQESLINQCIKNYRSKKQPGKVEITMQKIAGRILKF